MKKLSEDNTFLVYKCPYCGSGKITINKTGAHKYGYCDTCDAAYIHYIPLPHQLAMHKDKHKIKLQLGGMGSAKSNGGVMEIINHALNVPYGQTIMLAQTLKQLSKAIMPIFDEYLPRKFVEKWTDTKAEIEIVLTNGHKITGFASDDEEKFRSMNITAFLIEEASGVSPKIYQECVRRLRNVHGIINGVPHFVGILCSNPSQGFIRDLLFTADHIEGSASIQETVKMYDKRVTNKNPDLAAFLSSSRDNPYLPPGFVQSVINSLKPEEVRLYVDCIIEYAEGAVYPKILSYTIEDFEIPEHWERYVAHDPGINDPAAILLGAVNPDTGVIYFYTIRGGFWYNSTVRTFRREHGREERQGGGGFLRTREEGEYGVGRRAEPDQEGVRRTLDHAARRAGACGHPGDFHGRAVARPRPRRGRSAARARGGVLRTGVERQDDARPPRGGERPEGRGRRGIHRRGARARPRLREEDRREPR